MNSSCPTENHQCICLSILIFSSSSRVILANFFPCKARSIALGFGLRTRELPTTLISNIVPSSIPRASAIFLGITIVLFLLT